MSETDSCFWLVIPEDKDILFLIEGAHSPSCIITGIGLESNSKVLTSKEEREHSLQFDYLIIDRTYEETYYAQFI